MTQDFPDLRQGETWSEQSASKWRNLVDAIAAIDGLAVGPGLILDKAGQGWHLSLTPKPPIRIPPPNKSVVLVEVPSGNAADRPWLMVREVEYATPARLIEPEANPDHPYRWRDVAFQAFPQIGRTPDDYFSALWDEQDEGGVPLPSPTVEATFLTAVFDGSAWILALPQAAGAIEFCVVRNIEPVVDDDRIISIAFVRAGADGALAIETAVVLARPWPPLRSRHFRAFLWNGLTIQDETNVLPAIQIGGTWWVQQQLTWGELDLQSSLPISDCQV